MCCATLWEEQYAMGTQEHKYAMGTQLNIAGVRRSIDYGRKHS